MGAVMGEPKIDFMGVFFEQMRTLIRAEVKAVIEEAQPKQPAAPRFMGSEKFAHELGVSGRTVRHWCKKFGMPHQKAGSNYRIEPAKALAWLDANPRMRKAR
jgi:hypothetical protein